MLKIRLQRVGRKNDASFRVVVIESQRGPKAGSALEILGFYDPKKDIVEIKGDRATYWMSVGAQVSATVHNLLISKSIIKGKKINVLPKKSPIKKESPKTSEQSTKGQGNEVPKETPKVEEAVEEINSTEEQIKNEAKKEEPKEEIKKVSETEKSPTTATEEEKK